MITLFLQAFSIYSILAHVICGEVCFENYGCFYDTYPWGGTYERPDSLFPNRPEEIGTTFTLFNRALGDNGKFITHDNLGDAFDGSLKTKIIVHGYRDSVSTWVSKMKNELLQNEDMNIITVDWSASSSSTYLTTVSEHFLKLNLFIKK